MEGGEEEEVEEQERKEEMEEVFQKTLLFPVIEPHEMLTQPHTHTTHTLTHYTHTLHTHSHTTHTHTHTHTPWREHLFLHPPSCSHSQGLGHKSASVGGQGPS